MYEGRRVRGSENKKYFSIIDFYFIFSLRGLSVRFRNRRHSPLSSSADVPISRQGLRRSLSSRPRIQVKTVSTTRHFPVLGWIFFRPTRENRARKSIRYGQNLVFQLELRGKQRIIAGNSQSDFNRQSNQWCFRVRQTKSTRQSFNRHNITIYILVTL